MHSIQPPFGTSYKNRRWILLVFALLIVSTVFASAGGGGGGGSSDSDDGGILVLLWYILYLIPFPWNFVTIAVILVIYYFAKKKVKTFSGLNKIASFDDIGQQPVALPMEFLQRNPEFNEQKFYAKANTAFMEIQDAWMKQDLSGVRKWISDGVWQRFNTQFITMQSLGQKNSMSDIQVKTTVISDVQQDGNYDIIDVGIHFTMMDNFITENHPQLSTEGYLENVEYWTFIRKSGVPENDIFHSQNCPSCGAQLPSNMGEVGKCESCGVITTLGDYDWVLSEITQAADYVNDNVKLDKNGKLTQKIRAAMQRDADFSVQLMEDKASNGYMQIMSALVTKKPERMRRFADNTLFENLSVQIKNEPAFSFNRLYLNNVTLMDYYQDKGKDNMVIAFKRTAQKVSIASGTLQLLDYAPFTTNEIMVMSRDTGAGIPKGSLYAHSCPNCAGPVGDTLDLNCQYCGAALNSTKNEWIITQLLPAGAYASMISSQELPLVTNAGVNDLDPLFKVRDYALNNVMLIVAADGVFNQEEVDFTKRLAKKLGYDNDKLAGMYDLAKNNQLTIRLPENRKGALKVYEMMLKAASADGNISAEEQKILNDIQSRIAVLAD
ncbi:MAG: TIM44-like domain-containing protein [Bacteroidota bacterium]|nr:TIM44-like domain-containing protein [Bacteroidota bacterium]